MDLGIKGKVALVTGGSAGIGLAAAKSLAKEGCDVCVSARNPERLADAVVELQEFGGVVHAVLADVEDPDAAERVVRETRDVVGPVDILVANAGGPPAGRFVDASMADWELAIQRNLLGTVRLARAVLPEMRARGWGRIVTITSRSAREALDGLALSNSTRSAVAGLVRTLAREVGADGVLVNNVMPGSIDTERLRDLAGSEEALAERAGSVPLGRIGRPEEVGDVVAFLASERASYMNGVSVLVDGGESRVIA
ncbi:SDR family oxidoreductase [Nonomuraea glycinis]|uniref:Short-chain dehydrogenase n=1 Tax=Nonomuraea glycinis TaxID=2047744 RepID=A0A918AAP2_9ACTN|nr:SDR family oxidoreductase [Nonomuraea glycinis]MCA2182269.1 SDR family oxidoreductase [Nonomuraea glycinis]WSG63897.1 SDR family oxidoreductase [Nonomuraea glycinis]GGP11246.1 short-chain dehydrogenase [Nonomuraea glycinis]